MEFISFRADEELKKQIDKLASLENKNKSNEYREVFLLGMEEKKKTLAVEKYRAGELSIGAASELAGITSWEFLHLLKEKGTPINLTKEEVFKGVNNL